MASKMDGNLAAGEKKKINSSSDSVEYLLENEVIDIDTLKQFTIPKRKSHKQDVITRVDMMSREMGELVRVVKQAYRHRDSSDTFVYSRPRVVHNASLLNKFTNRKKRLRSDGYSDKELQETFVFLYYEEDFKACNACRDGVSLRNSSLTCLGDPKMGVYVSKYSDVLSSRILKNKTSGTLMILKLIKGRIKVMLDKSTVALDPSPNYDCHILKPPSNLDHSSPADLFEATQIYVYEYMEDSEPAERPSQLLPYALLTFRYDKLPHMSHLSHESSSSKFKKHLKRKSEKETEVQHKRNRHIIRKTISSGQSSDASHHSHQPYHSHHNYPHVPPKEQQLWSGGFEVAGISLGTVILQSSCPIIDASLLKWELKVEQQVTEATLKEVVLDGLGRLDLRKEVLAEGGLCVSCGILHPSSRASEQFTAYLEHLLTHRMVGYTVLSKHLDVFIAPIYFVRDFCLVSNEDALRPMLCCLFVSRQSINSMIKEHLKNCVQLEGVASGNQPVPSFLCTFTDAPASPEPESETPALNIRDPRIRFKTKSTKLNPNDPALAKQPGLDKCVIGSGRLMTVFENMASLQDASSRKSFSKSYKDEVHEDKKRPIGIEKSDVGRLGVGSSMTTHSPKLSRNDPRAKKTEPKASPVVEPNNMEPVVSSTVTEVVKPANTKVEAESSQNTQKFVLPEIVYATAIADPKVRQLLEDLKNKNIIGFGTKPQAASITEDSNQSSENKSEGTNASQNTGEQPSEEPPQDVATSSKESEYQSPSQEALMQPPPVQVPMQPPPFASPLRMEDYAKEEGSFPQETPHFPAYNYKNDFGMNQPNFPRGAPRFRGDFNAYRGRGRPFRPFQPRNRMVPPRDALDPRRHFPLPDPATFQKSFGDQSLPQQAPHLQQQQQPDSQQIFQPPLHHQSQDHQSPHHLQPPSHQPRHHPPPHFTQPIRHPPPTHLQPPPHHQQFPLQQHHQPHMLHHNPPIRQQPPYHHQQQQPQQQQQQQQHFQEHSSQSNQQHPRFPPSNKLDPRIKRSRFSSADSPNYMVNNSAPNDSNNQTNSHQEFNRYNRT